MPERFETAGSGSNDIVEGKYHAKISDINDITERVKEYADIALEIKVDAQGIPFELKTTIFIKFNRKPNGELDPEQNMWSGQINSLLDYMNYTGGFDKYGVFRNGQGEEIDEIAQELCTAYSQYNPNDEYNALVYVEHDSKGYATIKRKIFKITQSDKMDKYVASSNRMKSKPRPQMTVYGQSSGTANRSL